MATTILKTELRTLEKMLNKLAYTRDINQVFDDWLRYIIHGFCTNNPPLNDWHYSNAENRQFFEMIGEWMKVMNAQIPENSKRWYDAFGSLYEGCIAGRGRKDSRGQFFTPEHICDFMAMVQGNPDDENTGGKTVNDPTCGSGRLLLAYNALYPGNYLVAEDIDLTCCMMTVCNFLAHGCVGEVVWHDSLDPDSFYDAWLVNSGLNNPLSPLFGIPHITKVEYSQTRTYHVRKEQPQLSIPQAPQTLQLTLF